MSNSLAIPYWPEQDVTVILIDPRGNRTDVTADQSAPDGFDVFNRNIRRGYTYEAYLNGRRVYQPA